MDVFSFKMKLEGFVNQLSEKQFENFQHLKKEWQPMTFMKINKMFCCQTLESFPVTI